MTPEVWDWGAWACDNKGVSQYFAIHPENPQPRLLARAAEIIAGGGVVGSGPPGGRVPAEAACGGDLVARGGSARGESKMSCVASTLPILACSSM